MCKEVRGASLLVTHCGEAWYDVVFNSWRTLKRIYASMVRGNYGRKALPTPTPPLSLSVSLSVSLSLSLSVSLSISLSLSDLS